MIELHSTIKLTIGIIAVILVEKVSGADTIVPKSRGGCPDGYSSYKGYCEPYSSRSKEVIVRNERGSCPRGYSAKKGYCYKYSSSRESAITQEGKDCPKGYSSYKGYCQKQ